MLEHALAREPSTVRACHAPIGVGETFGTRWVVEGILSSSPMSTVYAAASARDRLLAVKVLSPEASDARFFREIRHTDAASTIGSPALIGYGTTLEGARYLALDRLAGSTLEQHCASRGGRFDLATALLLTERLLLVVTELHRVGIVHRDIHPANIFITSFGEVRVLDFSAASTAAEELPGESGGAAGFAPPEQLRGLEERGDVRVDLFAVGAVLFWMLTGSARPVARISMGTSRELPLDDIAHLPTDVLDFLELALAIEPHRRLASAGLMHAFLAGMRHALSGLERTADDA